MATESQHNTRRGPEKTQPSAVESNEFAARTATGAKRRNAVEPLVVKGCRSANGRWSSKNALQTYGLVCLHFRAPEHPNGLRFNVGVNLAWGSVTPKPTLRTPGWPPPFSSQAVMAVEPPDVPAHGRRTNALGSQRDTEPF